MVPRAIDLDCAAVAFTNPGAAIGDLFDLSLLHANATLSGRQGFKWGGTTIHGRGFLWVANSGGQTIVNGNVDDDNAAGVFDRDLGRDGRRIRLCRRRLSA